MNAIVRSILEAVLSALSRLAASLAAPAPVPVPVRSRARSSRN